MASQPFTLSTTPQTTIGAASRRRASVLITNKDASINIGLVDHAGQSFTDATEIAPGATRFYNHVEDGEQRLNSDFKLVAESGTPIALVQVNFL